jgi:hypothetical protein
MTSVHVREQSCLYATKNNGNGRQENGAVLQLLRIALVSVDSLHLPAAD